MAVDLIAEYAEQFWRKQRRQWEHKEIEVTTLEQNDANIIKQYEMFVEASEEQLVKDARELAKCVKEGQLDDLKPWYNNLNIGVVETKNRHAYQPLLYTEGARVVMVQPIPLNVNEKRVVEKLADLADGDDCLQGKDLFLIRNLTRGRGVSFFDDHGYYPDFIVWLKDANLQHLLFLDPKGLGRFGRKEQKKMQLHHEIKKVEQQVRKEDPDLRLSAYVLSVTPQTEIDDPEQRTLSKWKQDGVYFLNRPHCLKEVIEDALK